MSDWTNIEPGEVLSLRCKTHTAMIRLASVSGGWTFAVDCARLFGDHSGWSEPMGHRGGVLRRFALTRDEALQAARAVILSRLPDDQPLIDWLDTLAPAQPDLFAA